MKSRLRIRGGSLEPLWTEAECRILNTRRYRQAEEVDEPTRIDDDNGKSSRGYPAHHRQNRRHSSPKSSGTSPNYLGTTASENSPTFGSPARLNATAPA